MSGEDDLLNHPGLPVTFLQPCTRIKLHISFSEIVFFAWLSLKMLYILISKAQMLIEFSRN